MKKGFTLIELLVVVLIIGILAAIALPQYTTAVEKSRASEALALMGTIRYAAERYRLQNTAWPGTDMTVLDIEVPGTSCVTNKKCTKNYLFETSGTTTDPFVIKASRISNSTNGTLATGDLAYVLQTNVYENGTAYRTCTGGTDLKICKAIAAGNTTSF